MVYFSNNLYSIFYLFEILGKKILISLHKMIITLDQLIIILELQKKKKKHKNKKRIQVKFWDYFQNFPLGVTILFVHKIHERRK